MSTKNQKPQSVVEFERERNAVAESFYRDSGAGEGLYSKIFNFRNGYNAAISSSIVKMMEEALEYYIKSMGGFDSIMTDDGDVIHADVARETLTQLREIREAVKNG